MVEQTGGFTRWQICEEMQTDSNQLSGAESVVISKRRRVELSSIRFVERSHKAFKCKTHVGPEGGEFY